MSASRIPALVLLAFSVACDGAPDGPPSTRAPQKEASARPRLDDGKRIRVGNQAKGVEEQPDYDLAAIRIRERVMPRLPHPLPPAKAACTAMLDATRRFYATAERTEDTAVGILDGTRDADLKACVSETSPAAASCVAILSAEEEGEFSWLLDQCSRAFPRS